MSFLHGFIECASHGGCRSRSREIRRVLMRSIVGLPVAALLAISSWPQQKPMDLAEKSIEDLMNMDVTSVSKKEQKMSQVAAAMFVITQEDIRRSGAKNIPDLLRMVPGLDVGQINGSSWEISARGFNAQFANLLLVLIDGRTVYSPLFSGVYWDVQVVPLEDIDRIEVIRGPGATVWGSNAVNGVINIITKNSKDTQGGLVTAGGGTHEPGLGVAEYGGKFREAISYRIYVTGSDYNSYPSLSGQNGHDGSDLLQAGFRTDSILSKQDSLTVQGDIYKGSQGQVLNTISLTPPSDQALADEIHVTGANVLGRWNHTFSSGSDTSLQVYFDRTNRDRVIEEESVDTFDIDFQHHLGWGSRQDIVWGAGYRYTSYETTGTLTASFNPASQALHLFTTFVQDEITLKPDSLYLTIGAKIEHNVFTGFDFQPSARIAWSVTKDDMLWAGYSRARSTPSPEERGIRYGLTAFAGQGGLPVLSTLTGSPATVNENLDALEAGYRAQLRANISVDLAVYYNRYGNLQTVEPGSPFLELNPPPPHLNVPFVFANLMHGEAHGLEMSVNWKVTDRWTVSPGYAFERIYLHTSAASHDTTTAASVQGGTPHVQAQLRSNLALPRKLEWNTSVYFVGLLPAPQVPSYTRLDTGLTWRPSEHLDVSLVGQNLVRDHHLEAVGQLELSSLIKRSAYAKMTWIF